jgi:hypothetical protein
MEGGSVLLIFPKVMSEVTMPRDAVVLYSLYDFGS